MICFGKMRDYQTRYKQWIEKPFANVSSLSQTPAIAMEDESPHGGELSHVDKDVLDQPALS